MPRLPPLASHGSAVLDTQSPGTANVQGRDTAYIERRDGEHFLVREQDADILKTASLSADRKYGLPDVAAGERPIERGTDPAVRARPGLFDRDDGILPVVDEVHVSRSCHRAPGSQCQHRSQ
jgi:hypothetical protein